MVTSKNQNQNFREYKYLLRIWSFNGFLLVIESHNKTPKSLLTLYFLVCFTVIL